MVSQNGVSIRAMFVHTYAITQKTAPRLMDEFFHSLSEWEAYLILEYLIFRVIWVKK